MAKPSNKPREKVTVSLTPAIVSAIEKYARGRGLSVTEWIRALVGDEVQRLDRAAKEGA